MSVGVGQLALEIVEQVRLLEREQIEAIDRLVDLLAVHDPATGAHSRRIGMYAARLAEAADLGPGRVSAIGLAAPLHDIGKLAIPDAVLLKPGPLDSAERALMERHAQIGHDLLADTRLALFDAGAEIALTHHERFDGGGYPAGVAGDRIPLAGRIVAIADAYDFLVNDRPYHRPVSRSRAIESLRAEGDSHFDPYLLDLFIECLDAILNDPSNRCAPGG
jgi:putative two-component system response regulator